MALKLKAKYPADRSKLGLTEPIGEPIILVEKSYENCPLYSTGECPIQEKIKLVADVRSENIRGE